MATIQLTTTNYNGQNGNVTFYPCNSGLTSSNLGLNTFPMEIIDTENYEGTYQVQFTGLTSGYDQFCYVQVPCSGCNRPTSGLILAELFVQYNSISYSGYTADMACAAADYLNNPANIGNYTESSILVQIDDSNGNIYRTDFLGDCTTVPSAYYIMYVDGQAVVKHVTDGVLDAGNVDCNSLPTPTPTPTIDVTVTPSPTPTATPEPTTPPQTYSVQIAGGVGGPSGSACINAQQLNGMITVYSLFNNGGQLPTSTETLYSDAEATTPYEGFYQVFSDGTVYGTISTSGVFAFQGYCSGI